MCLPPGPLPCAEATEPVLAALNRHLDIDVKEGSLTEMMASLPAL